MGVSGQVGVVGSLAEVKRERDTLRGGAGGERGFLGWREGGVNKPP